MTETTEKKLIVGIHGWVLYDGDCPMCNRFAKRFAKTLRHRRFDLAPLQNAWVRAHPKLNINYPPKEMVVFTSSGDVYGGADSIVFLSQLIWWAWPIYLFSKLPGAMYLLHVGYRWVANHRKCGLRKNDLYYES